MKKNKLLQSKNNQSASSHMTVLKRANSKKLFTPSISSIYHNKKENKGLIITHKQKSKIKKKDSINLSSSHKKNFGSSKDILFRNRFIKLTRKTSKFFINSAEEQRIKNFYTLRARIRKNFTQKYSPYMGHLIKKGLYKNCSEDDYPKYYNYYQIDHLINKKRFRLSIMYDEFILFNDGQEYLL